MSEKQEQKALTIFDFSVELQAKIETFKKDWYLNYKKISKQKTPTFDGAGRQILKKRPDGKDYIEAAWMADRLTKYFPGWSWEAAAPLHFLGAEWVVAQGHLVIVDERLLTFGINPPVRKFYGVDAVRIQYKSGSTHTPENIIDIGDNCQSAVTGAQKRAINRLTGIGDDVYGKRVEEQGAGSIESIITGNAEVSVDNQSRMFGKFLSEKHISVSKALEILKITKLSEIKDYKAAHDTLVKELDL